MALTGSDRRMRAAASSDGATAPVTAARLNLKAPGPGRDLALFDALTTPAPEAGRQLTSILAAGYEATSLEADGDFARLALVERQAALFRLACAHGHWPAWFVMACPDCAELIDIRVSTDEFTCAQTSNEPLMLDGRRFMWPTGEHEAAIAEGADAVALAHALCIDGPLRADEAEALAPQLAEALEADAARLTTSLPIACPHCKAEVRFWFDPVDWIGRHVAMSLRNVHALASAYGWSEAEILALPEARLKAYLTMIGVRA